MSRYLYICTHVYVRGQDITLGNRSSRVNTTPSCAKENQLQGVATTGRSFPASCLPRGGAAFLLPWCLPLAMDLRTIALCPHPLSAPVAEPAAGLWWAVTEQSPQAWLLEGWWFFLWGIVHPEISDEARRQGGRTPEWQQRLLRSTQHPSCPIGDGCATPPLPRALVQQRPSHPEPAGQPEPQIALKHSPQLPVPPNTPENTCTKRRAWNWIPAAPPQTAPRRLDPALLRSSPRGKKHRVSEQVWPPVITGV